MDPAVIGQKVVPFSQLPLIRFFSFSKASEWPFWFKISFEWRLQIHTFLCQIWNEVGILPTSLWRSFFRWLYLRCERLMILYIRLFIQLNLICYKSTAKAWVHAISCCSKRFYWRCVIVDALLLGTGSCVSGLFHTGVSTSEWGRRALCSQPHGCQFKLYQQRGQGKMSTGEEISKRIHSFAKLPELSHKFTASMEENKREL